MADEPTLMDAEEHSVQETYFEDDPEVMTETLADGQDETEDPGDAEETQPVEDDEKNADSTEDEQDDGEGDGQSDGDSEEDGDDDGQDEELSAMDKAIAAAKDAGLVEAEQDAEAEAEKQEEPNKEEAPAPKPETAPVAEAKPFDLEEFIETLNADDKAYIADLREDDPQMLSVMAKMAQRIAGSRPQQAESPELHEQLEQMADKLAQMEFNSQVMAKHPDMLQIVNSKEWQDFQESAPPAIQRLASQPDPDMASLVLDAFKEHRAKGAATKVDAEAKARHEKTKGVLKGTLKTGGTKAKSAARDIEVEQDIYGITLPASALE